MCGIAGWVDVSGHSRESEVQAMILEMGHRGPDASGIRVKGNVSLGHRRLSIIDTLDRASQPMLRENLALVFNGEIYNYVELRAQLSLCGYEFSTGSDTEVLLAAFRHWGPECVHHLDGMWAFAIHDALSGRIFCSRDPFGEKPFLYSSDARGFIFASEARALRRVGVGVQADSTSVLGFVALGRLPTTTESWGHGVSSLPPGHNLVVDVETLEVWEEPYFEMSTSESSPPTDGEDFTRAFESTLERTVARRLRSDVPVGTLLSGGIDSSLLCAVAAPIYRQQTGDEIVALTASSGDVTNDESEAARFVAAKSGAHWERVRVDPAMDHDYWLEATRDLQQPLSSLSVCMQREVYQRASSLGLKVVLDGQGADEVWLGYARHRFMSLPQVAARDLPRFLHQSVARSELSTKEAASMLLYFRFPAIPALRTFALLRGSSLDVDVRALYRWYRDSVGSGSRSAHEVQRRELQGGQLQSLLAIADMNAMRYSVEARLPYLGAELSLLGGAASLGMLFGKGWSKRVLREALDRRGLSTIAWNRRKIGFEANSASFDPDADYVRASIKSSVIVRQLGIGATGSKRYVWRLYALSLWESACNIEGMA